MSFTSFDDIKSALMSKKEPINCAVVSAHSARVIEAVLKAYDDGFIYPILIGDELKINEMIGDHAKDNITVINSGSPEESMQIAIGLVNEGKAQCLMKGLLDSNVFLSGVIKRENGIRTGGQVSLVSFRSIPNYHKLVCMTDPGICPHPTLEQKKAIIENAVKVYHQMGIDNPKVAVLCAAEKVNQKAPETAEADALKQMALNGEITGCQVEGPISIDLALDKHSSEIKGFNSPVAGDADILLFPDMASANIASKLMAFSTNEPAGVLLVGTKIPVIFNSRASSVETKYLCILLATACYMG